MVETVSIRFCGAAGEVTGSGYVVRSGRASVLVDFGIFQGGEDSRTRSQALGPFDAAELDAVVLTHAHIDHSGRLPLVKAAGFAGPVYATPATLDLAALLLEDYARIQEADLAKENRRGRRQGLAPLKPMFTSADVEEVRASGVAVPYPREREVAPGITARFFEAGHILGSASVELTIGAGDARRTVVFSGDIGPCGAPILRDPERPRAGDLVFLESTCDGRDRRTFQGNPAQCLAQPRAHRHSCVRGRPYPDPPSPKRPRHPSRLHGAGHARPGRWPTAPRG